MNLSDILILIGIIAIIIASTIFLWTIHWLLGIGALGFGLMVLGCVISTDE